MEIEPRGSESSLVIAAHIDHLTLYHLRPGGGGKHPFTSFHIICERASEDKQVGELFLKVNRIISRAKAKFNFLFRAEILYSPKEHLCQVTGSGSGWLSPEVEKTSKILERFKVSVCNVKLKL